MNTLQVKVFGGRQPSWPLSKIHRILRVRRGIKNEGMLESNLLSLSYGRIVRRDIEAGKGLLPESYETYQIVEAGNIVMRLTDLQNDKRSLRQGLVQERGIITSAYDALETAPHNDPRFWAYTLLALDSAKYYYSLGGGVRQSIKFADFPNEWISVPDLPTQKAIAAFLDRETARSDQLIAKKERLVEVLAEKFHATVEHTVTHGIDGEDTIVESGIDTIGAMPAHWEAVGLGKKIVLQRGVDITKDQQAQDGEYPVVSSGGVASFHDTYICKGPGVLIGRKGSAGKLHYEQRNYWPHDTTLYVKHFFGNVPKFVYYKLMAMDLGSFDRSSANPTINRNLVHPIKVSWPPVSDQVPIVRYLDHQNRQRVQMESKVNASIQKLAEFRSALITAAVTGQIDVATWGRRGETDRRLDEIAHDLEAERSEAVG